MKTQLDQGGLMMRDVMGCYLLGQKYITVSLIITSLIFLIGFFCCHSKKVSQNQWRSATAIILILDLIAFSGYVCAFFALRESLVFSVLPAFGWAILTLSVSGVSLWRLRVNFVKSALLTMDVKEIRSSQDETVWPPPPSI